MAEALQIEIESSKKDPGRADDHFNQKITSLENIFLVSNFVLELPSAVFDQLSSVHKPQFALLRNLLQTRSDHSNLRKLHREKEFTLAELAAATYAFSDDYKVGDGRFGVVYKGRLQDGREGTIKRKYIDQQKNIEEDSVYEAELLNLLRLHHKHLVGLLGYCEQGTERLLVFKYMPNGTLYNQLFHTDGSMIDSWLMRIRIALDAARGIDYLHNYAVPPIIHRAINSSCILLDKNWTARVCDFGLMGLEYEQEYKSKMAKERDGYVDPEYNGVNVLTAKSDVYSFGVVLLELLTGKMTTFDMEGKPTNLVEFSVPKIMENQCPLILDNKIGPPECVNEAKAIEMVAHSVLHCVNSDGIKRPTTTCIVNHLEQALSILSDNSRIESVEQKKTS